MPISVPWLVSADSLFLQRRLGSNSIPIAQISVPITPLAITDPEILLCKYDVGKASLCMLVND
jgi:hypothetical protein